MKFAGMPAAAGFLLLAAFTSRATTVYTDQTSFVNDLAPGYYLETFNNVGIGNLGTSVSYSGNGYSYTGLASGGYSYDNGQFYGGDESNPCTYFTCNPVLSVTQQGTQMVFTFSPNVTAVGGNFFMQDDSGNITSGTMYLNLADGTQLEIQGGDSNGTTFTLSDGTTVSTYDTPPFSGFTSSVAIQSLTINSNRMSSIDNLYVGTSLETATLPEPSTAGLMLPAFGLLWIALRWNARRNPAAS